MYLTVNKLYLNKLYLVVLDENQLVSLKLNIETVTSLYTFQYDNLIDCPIYFQSFDRYSKHCNADFILDYIPLLDFSCDQQQGNDIMAMAILF